MTILKALCISFSIYSKIPVPIFEWKEEELKYHLIFFPWIGAVIGVLIMLWTWIASLIPVGQMAFVLITAAIPLLVTGGFHVDGFMDTMDAIKSYKSRQEKLEILKDPHIGAFSVIMLAAAGLIFTAAVSVIGKELMPCFAGCFFLSRCLSAAAVILFPSAKKDGMLSEFSRTANSRVRNVLLAVIFSELAICVIYLAVINLKTGLLLTAASIFTLLYYRYKSNKEFGGTTGDTAGYFVVICEIVCAICAAAGTIWF